MNQIVASPAFQAIAPDVRKADRRPIVPRRIQCRQVGCFFGEGRTLHTCRLRSSEAQHLLTVLKVTRNVLEQ